MPYTAEILTSAIVVLGHFNPAIFSPDWMEKNSLIGSGDAESVRQGSQGKPLIVSHQVAAFEAKWFALQVLENQFSLTSKDAFSPAFKDLAVSIFQLIPHTPVTALGLNFLAHFKLANEDEYHRVGDVLAPKNIWSELYPNEHAGLANLTIRVQQGARGDAVKSKDEKRIAVQPSSKFKFGAYLSYNAHREIAIGDEENVKPGERAASIIDSEWEPAWHDAMRVFDGVLSRALSG